MPVDVEKLWRDLEWDAPVLPPPPVKKAHAPVLPAVKQQKKKKHRGGLGSRARSLDKWHRKCAKRIGEMIAADFERERKRLLAETLKKQKEYDLELVLMAAEEKRQAEVKAYYTECQRQAAVYIEKLRKAAA